ncbi:MAG: Efflux transporter, family, subunit [Pedosphaera sp.]|nr:Efflux transporter, family, subunit [Pedosphaera sp.]
MPAPAIEEKPPTPAAPQKQNRRFQVLAGAGMLIAGVAVAVYYLQFVAPYESTDDAFIEAHVTPVAPQVPGRVTRLLVSDNEAVKKGDVLLQIDPRDYQVKVDQAHANLTAATSRLEQAKAQFAVDQAKAQQELANVTATEAEANRAGADLKRYQSVEARAVSRSQIDLVETQARSSTAQVDVARNKARAAEAQVGLSKANIETAAADIRQNEAAVRQAELDLSYTQVVAPEDGLVTRRTVETGAYVQTGQALLAIVPRQVWVVANFKETQLAHMHAGQPVDIKMDAFPKIQFKGHVDSIQAGSGARFSMLPPENASGNYVKVVQRVPVKIVFDDNADTTRLLGPGMSVVPQVKVN